MADQLTTRAISEEDPRWGRLRNLIEHRALKRGEFTLTSGRSSTYLFQLRQITLHPVGACLIAEIIAGFMRNRHLVAIGGLEMGAVPIVAAVAAESARIEYPVEAFFVRKKAKDHGDKAQIDGLTEATRRILAVDDVTTTGGSILKAIDALPLGTQVSEAMSIVDREEGAFEALSQRGIRLFSIFRKSDFGL